MKQLIDYQYMIQELETYSPDNFLFRFTNWEMVYWKFAYAFTGLALCECNALDSEKLMQLPLPTEYCFIDDAGEGPYEEGYDGKTKFYSRNQLFEEWNGHVHRWIDLLDNVHFIESVYDCAEESSGFCKHLRQELSGLLLMNSGVMEPQELAELLNIDEDEAEELISEEDYVCDWVYGMEGICVFDYSEMEKAYKRISVKEDKSSLERAFAISYLKLNHSEFIQYMPLYADFYSDEEESKKYYTMIVTCEPLEVNRAESFDPFHIIHYLVAKERYEALMAEGDEMYERQCQISA